MANEQQQPRSRKRTKSAVSGKNLRASSPAPRWQKTIVVKVTRAVQHPLYQRVVRSREEILRARRDRRGEAGRHGTHRFNASAFEAEAVAA